METIRIVNGSKDKLSENLTMQEVYNSTDPDQEWDCPVALIKAFQIIRDWIGKPLICSSTYRHPDKYGTWSAHDKGLAIDMYSKAIDVISLYNAEITKYLKGEKSELIENLRQAGIDGFGIEGGCIHLDCGGYGIGKRITHTDAWGQWTAFEWRNGGKINRAL
jgi:hypothetical protein